MRRSTQAFSLRSKPERKAKNLDPKAIVAYLRVSTEEQGLGMEAQRNAIKAWADLHGVKIAAWYEDFGISGGAELEDRIGLLAALEGIREHRAGSLVAHKADRIARDVYVAECVKRALLSAGASLVLVEGISGTDPFQELAATVMDAAARFERRMIAARTKAALGVKRARGEKTGGSCPFGFQLAADAIHLEPNPTEQPTLARILALRRAGFGGRRIASILTNEGYMPRGKAWHPGNVHAIANAALEAAS